MSGLRDFQFDVDRYLRARGDARITNWAAWIANAKFRDDDSRAGAENWLHFPDRGSDTILVDAGVVRDRLKAIVEDEDLRKYIL